jgi:hypothetical protein
MTPVAPYITESRSLGWDGLKNGESLDVAEAAGFEVFVTTDKNIRYRQNLSERKMAIVVPDRGRWRPIRPMLWRVVAAVDVAKPGRFIEIAIRINRAGRASKRN